MSVSYHRGDKSLMFCRYMYQRSSKITSWTLSIAACDSSVLSGTQQGRTTMIDYGLSVIQIRIFTAYASGSTCQIP